MARWVRRAKPGGEGATLSMMGKLFASIAMDKSAPRSFGITASPSSCRFGKSMAKNAPTPSSPKGQESMYGMISIVELKKSFITI